MKIVTSGKALHSPEFHRKRSRVKKFKIIALTSLLILAIVGLILLTRMEKFLISDVIVSGDAAIREEDVVRAVVEAISGNYLLVIPKRNALLYSRGSVVEAVMSEMPRIKELDLRLVDPRTLEVSIVERLPHALFCNSTDGIGNCYLIDKDGFIFASSPDFSGGVYFTYKRNMTEPIGQHFLATEEFLMLESFVAKISDLGFDSTSLSVDESSPHRTKYALTLTGGGEVWWNDVQDSNLVYSNLETFFLSDIAKLNPRFLDSVSYIDLRTDNKVFYKFKE